MYKNWIALPRHDIFSGEDSAKGSFYVSHIPLDLLDFGFVKRCWKRHFYL